jgi:hypothetical protein
MRRFCDSASVPTPAALRAAHSHGVTAWTCYLPSPYAYRSWRAAESNGVLAEIGAILPIYVGPYPKGPPTTYNIRAALAAASPSQDAARLIQGLRAISGRAYPTHRLPVAVDMEANVWIAAPTAVISYLTQLIAAVDHQAPGLVDMFPYSSVSCLKGLERLRFRHVWCASWLKSTTWPAAVSPPGLDGMWAGQRAWQFHGATNQFGMTVDLNVADDAFPFLLHHAPPPAPPAPKPAPAAPPKPAPAPTPAKTAAATIVVDGTTYRGRLTAT